MEDMWSTIHNLNKEKLEFYKELTLMKEEKEKLINDKKELIWISKSFEAKRQEYEE